MEKLLKDRHLQALLVLCIIYATYWTLYGNYQYTTYNDQFFDMGAFMSTFYQHLSCPNVAGLQYLVFSNHIAPFLLLVLPFFALFPYPIVLFAIQAIFLALAAMAIYFVCKDLLNSRNIGLVLAFAFLISPAVRGLTIYDFHEEAFIPLLYILSFYFLWKADRKHFIIAYSLMLGVFEPSVVVGLALLAGLLFYELLYDRGISKDHAAYEKRMRLIAIGVAITILFGLFYFGLDAYLLNAYQSAPYSSVPPIEKVIPFLSVQINSLVNSTTVQSIPGHSLYLAYYGPIGTAIEFLGFGITSLISPVLSMILLSPWLGELFIMGNVSFAFPESQYLGFFSGASVVAAIMGLLIIKERRTFLSRWIRYGSRRFELSYIFCTLLAAIIISALILMGTNSVQSLLLDNAPAINYTQINSAIAAIPLNTSVMAQSDLSPHLYGHCSLELAPINRQWISTYTPTVFWFKPQYIILDKKLSGYYLMVDNGAGFGVYNYAKGNYTEVYNKSGVYILKEIN